MDTIKIWTGCNLCFEIKGHFTDPKVLNTGEMGDIYKAFQENKLSKVWLPLAQSSDSFNHFESLSTMQCLGVCVSHLQIPPKTITHPA